MRSAQICQIGAAGFVFLSIMCSLLANQTNASLMGKAALGVAVWAPTTDSPEWKQKEKLKTQVDRYFYGGVLFALLGLSLEIARIFADRKPTLTSTTAAQQDAKDS